MRTTMMILASALFLLLTGCPPRDAAMAGAQFAADTP